MVINLFFLPTGDGICIALLDIKNPFDIHIVLSLKILELLNKYNESQEDEMRKFKVRIGINENTDNLIIDINKSNNIAGAGINNAQRIMNSADGSNILVGQSVHERLSQREKYFDRFKKYSTIVKHNITLNLYQYVDTTLKHLNSEVPSALKPQKKKEYEFDKLVAYLIGQILKNEQFIKDNLKGGSPALSVLMIFLAKDSVGYSEASEYDPYESHLPKPNESLEENLKYFEEIDIWICMGYVEMFYDLEIKRYWDVELIHPLRSDYFVPYMDGFEITEKAREKLKTEWPQIVEELGID